MGGVKCVPKIALNGTSSHLRRGRQQNCSALINLMGLRLAKHLHQVSMCRRNLKTKIADDGAKAKMSLLFICNVRGNCSNGFG